MKLDKNARIYIAGHRGLVGSALVRILTARGFSRLVVKTSAELDLRNQASVSTFFEKERPEYVFLAAAKVGGILANSTYKAEFIYDNLAIATNVLESAYRSGVTKLLNLGSSCIYPKLAPQPLREDHLLTGLLEETNEPYAIAKIAAIKLCRYYNEQYGTRFLSLMPTNLYGPNDNFNMETAHVLPSLMRRFHLGQLLQRKARDEILTDIEKYPLGFGFAAKSSFEAIKDKLREIGVTADVVTLWGSGTPRREFLHVDDFAEASLFVMDREPGDIGELLNVGVGQDQTIQALADLVKRIVGYEGAVAFDHTHPDGTPRKLLDVSRLAALGWNASRPLEEGLRHTFAWYKQSMSTSVVSPILR